MIKAIIFDWFGVCAEKWLDVLRRELGDLADPDSLKKSFVRHLDDYVSSKISGKRFLESLFADLGLETEGYEYLITKPAEVNRELMDIIISLRKAYKTVLLSDNLNVMVPIIEKQIGGFSRYFDVVVLSNVLKMVKIEGEMFRIALDRIKERPENCVFIDDRERNTTVAKKLGFKTILYENNDQMKEELSGLGVDIEP